MATCPGLAIGPHENSRGCWPWQSLEEPGQGRDTLLPALSIQPASAASSGHHRTGTSMATSYLCSIDVQIKLNSGRGIYPNFYAVINVSF